MKLIDQSFEITQWLCDDSAIERIGRVCWKSEDRITEDSSNRFIKMLLEKNHQSVLEHSLITVKLITSRAIANELVRHRLASYTQKSSRYVREFDAEIIKPIGFDTWEPSSQYAFQKCIHQSCKSYEELLRFHAPEVARDVLPLGLATEIYISANAREWLHIFNMRTHKSAHPQMVELMKQVLIEFQKRSVIFQGV